MSVPAVATAVTESSPTKREGALRRRPARHSGPHINHHPIIYFRLRLRHTPFYLSLRVATSTAVIMSGGLNAQYRDWQRERADAVKRNIPSSAKSSTPKPSTPKPSSNASFAAPPSSAVPESSLPQSQSVGSELMSRVVAAKDYLRDRRPAMKTLDDILSFLSIPTNEKTTKTYNMMRRALQSNERTEFIPAPESGALKKEAFRYRPMVPVSNPDELREYLVRMSLESARGLLVKDLKDGWPDCGPAIDELERQGYVLVVRNKKDNTPKLLYADDPSFYPPSRFPPSDPAAVPHVGFVDQDLKDQWAKLKLPANENDIRTELERAGITPTSQVKEVKPIGGTGRKEKKVRKEKKNAKKTNVHMAGILKDYSHKRPGGK
ncbi:hypothetical protein D0868_06132 [Hortaea werneckii]|uniref:TFIIE beta domain-containing protein n=1 Tax=Hortaea werneckii TaxID=91943 RepID=A0A3M6YSM7_HORWE|nr:hypothetical protein D0868_06132 [Hortaea werneckii]